MPCVGLMRNFKGLVACRVILSPCEAGFSSGTCSITTSQHKRSKVQQQFAPFCTAYTMSGAFSGPVAFATARPGEHPRLALIKWHMSPASVHQRLDRQQSSGFLEAFDWTRMVSARGKHQQSDGHNYLP